MRRLISLQSDLIDLVLHALIHEPGKLLHLVILPFCHLVMLLLLRFDPLLIFLHQELLLLLDLLLCVLYGLVDLFDDDEVLEVLGHEVSLLWALVPSLSVLWQDVPALSGVLLQSKIEVRLYSL